jgi:hypothetical protein
VRIEKSGVSEKVYDLMVESTPEFFVNGILVHNCVDATRYALDDEINAYGPTKMENVSGR